MTEQLWVLGSGKMGRDIGTYFLARGWSVRWVSRAADRLAPLERQVSRTVRRLARLPSSPRPLGAFGFHTADGLDRHELPAPALVIETIEESLTAKRALLASLDGLLPEGAVLASNSSSLLPWQIHPRCLGLHFFYPVQLTGLVELVAAPDHPGLERTQQWLQAADLDVVVQGERQAFAANRLLLPCQVECLSALQAGAAAPEVDEASRMPLLPGGLLGMMDAVGLDTIAAAVEHYVARMAPGAVDDYQPLQRGLRELAEQGKRGAKSRDGLLVGQPLPWAPRSVGPPARQELAERLQALLLHTCDCFLERGDVQPQELDRIAAAVWGAELTVQGAWDRVGREAVATMMAGLYNRSGASYFAPLSRG